MATRSINFKTSAKDTASLVFQCSLIYCGLSMEISNCSLLTVRVGTVNPGSLQLWFQTVVLDFRRTLELSESRSELSRSSLGGVHERFTSLGSREPPFRNVYILV